MLFIKSKRIPQWKSVVARKIVVSRECESGCFFETRVINGVITYRGGGKKHLGVRHDFSFVMRHGN